MIKKHQNSWRLGALDPTGELTALLQSPSLLAGHCPAPELHPAQLYGLQAWPFVLAVEGP